MRETIFSLTSRNMRFRILWDHMSMKPLFVVSYFYKIPKNILEKGSLNSIMYTSTELSHILSLDEYKKFPGTVIIRPLRKEIILTFTYNRLSENFGDVEYIKYSNQMASQWRKRIIKVLRDLNNATQEEVNAYFNEEL